MVMDYIKNLLGLSATESYFILSDKLCRLEGNFDRFIQYIIDKYGINLFGDLKLIKEDFRALDRNNQIIISFEDYCEYQRNTNINDCMLLTILKSITRTNDRLENTIKFMENENLSLIYLIKTLQMIKICVIKREKITDNRVHHQHYVLKFSNEF